MEGVSKMKNKLMRVAAKGVRRLAEVACESSSLCILYQPKTPKALLKRGEKPETR